MHPMAMLATLVGQANLILYDPIIWHVIKLVRNLWGMSKIWRLLTEDWYSWRFYINIGHICTYTWENGCVWIYKIKDFQILWRSNIKFRILIGPNLWGFIIIRVPQEKLNKEFMRILPKKKGGIYENLSLRIYIDDNFILILSNIGILMVFIIPSLWEFTIRQVLEKISKKSIRFLPQTWP